MEGTRPYILAVDDSPDTADSFAALLDLWGYDARACYSGAEALDAARTRRPDAVLLDIGMPDMDGFRVGRLLRELPGCGMTLVIAITGHTPEAYRARGREAGFDHYLIKPIDPDPLKSLLERGIGRPDAAEWSASRDVKPHAPVVRVRRDGAGCGTRGV
jgi:CheY-like chemotaxis protein